MDYEHKEYYLKLPSIHSGQSDELVLEDAITRVWVSRCEQGDDDKPLVTVEMLQESGWKVTDTL